MIRFTSDVTLTLDPLPGEHQYQGRDFITLRDYVSRACDIMDSHLSRREIGSRHN